MGDPRKQVASDTVSSAIENLDYDFYGHPRYEPREAYEEAREVFIERIDAVPGVVSVYESGSGVSRPGISDIDLIVIVEDEIADPGAVREGIQRAKVDEYYFFHGPEVLTRDTFAEYYNVLPMPKDLHLLYGEELPHEKNDDRYNYLCYLVDSVNTTYPMEFLDFLFFPGISFADHRMNIVASDLFDLFVPRPIADRFLVEIDSRFALHRLNSLRNDMMLFVESSGRDAPRLETFNSAITDLRDQWFDLDRDAQEALLLERLQDSVTACFVFLDHLVGQLADLPLSVNAAGDELRPQNVYHNEYRKDWDSGQAEADTCHYCRHDRVKTCVLPQAVTVNDRIRSNDVTVSAPDEYVQALERRDRTKASRDRSMATYKYHPLRSQYMSVVRALFGLKIRITR